MILSSEQPPGAKIIALWGSLLLSETAVRLPSKEDSLSHDKGPLGGFAHPLDSWLYGERMRKGWKGTGVACHGICARFHCWLEDHSNR